MGFLSGYKTYIISGLMVLIGVTEGLSTGGGLVGLLDQLPTILTGAGFGALRAGVAKGR